MLGELAIAVPDPKHKNYKTIGKKNFYGAGLNRRMNARIIRHLVRGNSCGVYSVQKKFSDLAVTQEKSGGKPTFPTYEIIPVLGHR
jgi:hypothetical protein